MGKKKLQCVHYSWPEFKPYEAPTKRDINYAKKILISHTKERKTYVIPPKRFVRLGEDESIFVCNKRLTKNDAVKLLKNKERLEAATAWSSDETEKQFKIKK